MKQRFIFLLKFYASLLGIFIIAKGGFMAYNGFSAHDASFSDFFSVVLHGLPLDCATAGYVTAPLWLLLLVSVWVRIPKMDQIYKVYSGIMAAILSLALLSDICLYEFWGIKLDGTVFNYLDNPKGVIASVTTMYLIVSLVVFLLIVYGVYRFLRLSTPGKELSVCSPRKTQSLNTLYFVLIGGLLFLAIRGGIGKSTANVGMVYYSENTYLNHSAVNPVFSIVSSTFKTKDFGKMHDYFPEEKRAEIFDRLGYNTKSVNSDTLLNTQRPNVLVILMEGCGGSLVHAVDPEARPDVTPNLNRLAEEGVFFSQCYANSFRTDRGTVCAFSGYPSFPDVSVMKIPSKCEHLPSIAGSLQKAGYRTEFLYGGDINFTNTNGYLLSTGYKTTFGDTSFSPEERKTHNWGVTDSITFNRLFDMIMAYPTDRPWHTGFLTLASHEPWGVPYNRIPEDKIYNAFGYLDDCIGKFIERFRQTPQWDNTLIVILPDHGIGHPGDLSDANPKKSHIPLIWTGGAVKAPRRIDVICNQTDLCATLLGQLGLPHDDFHFSRDVLSDTYTHPSAVHSWSEGIYYKDETGYTVLNLLTKPQQIITDSPQPSPQRSDAANAFLQTCYDDLGGM